MVLDATGWFGGIVLVIAYLLVSTRRVSADGLWFQWLNIVGGVLLTGSTLYRGALPNAVTNLVWIGLGVYALVAAHRRHRAASPVPLPAEVLPGAQPASLHRLADALGERSRAGDLIVDEGPFAGEPETATAVAEAAVRETQQAFTQQRAALERAQIALAQVGARPSRRHWV